jgi:hypothetical protein
MRRLPILSLAAALLSACSTPSGPPERLRFALVGDAPYGTPLIPRWNAFLAELAAPGARNTFLLHAGDLKGSAEPCTDALLAERLEPLRQLPLPVLLTPGDNDWTDCHWEPAGRFLPTERLARLRQLAWHQPAQSLGSRPIALQHQGATGHPENALFVAQGVVVASLHQVGSENGLFPWKGLGETADPVRAERIAEVRAREAANRVWLDAAFDRAAQAEALVLLMQANPRWDLSPEDPLRAPFEPFTQQLLARVKALGRPVLLLHGDFHQFVHDIPFRELPLLERVQTFGHPQMGAVRVRVVEGTPLRFVVEPLPLR